MAPAETKLRIGLLTRAGGSQGRRIAEKLAYMGIRLDVVLFENPLRFIRKAILEGGRSETHVECGQNATNRFLSWCWGYFGEAGKFAAVTDMARVTGNLNSKRMKRDLRAESLDVLILGDIGIIDAETLQAINLAVINAHPGLLPWVRGTGVVGRALLCGLPVGCTCHYVDTGIDTGPQIERRLVGPIPDDCNLRDLEDLADELCVNVLSDVVRKIRVSNQLPTASHSSCQFDYCSWLTSKEREDLNADLVKGKAANLLKTWQENNFCNETYSVLIDAKHVDMVIDCRS